MLMTVRVSTAQDQAVDTTHECLTETVLAGHLDQMVAEETPNRTTEEDPKRHVPIAMTQETPQSSLIKKEQNDWRQDNASCVEKPVWLCYGSHRAEHQPNLAITTCSLA